MNDRRQEFHASKKSLTQRLIEGLNLQYNFENHSYTVDGIWLAAERLERRDADYLLEKFRGRKDLVEKTLEIYRKAIEERPLTALCGKLP